MFVPRAQRSVKRLSAFGVASEKDNLSGFDLADEYMEEGAIGVYRSSSNSIDDVFFSNQAIYLHKNRWVRIAYIDIESVCSDIEFKQIDKSEAIIIRLNFKTGEVSDFNISGIQDEFRDYFTVYQFLHRIIADLTNK